MIRESARGVLLTPAGEVLLMRLSEVWVTPGGGVEPGESVQDALLRELREECGFAPSEVGAELWQRRYDAVLERFFLVRCERFTPRFGAPPDRDFQTYRWWRVEEIAASQDLFAPRALASLLARVVAGDLSHERVEGL